MPDDIQSIFEKKIKPTRFKRTIGLFGATTTGVGALMGAGIYVLKGSIRKIPPANPGPDGNNISLR